MYLRKPKRKNNERNIKRSVISAARLCGLTFRLWITILQEAMNVMYSLDEPNVHRFIAREVGEVHQLVLIQPTHDHAVNFQGVVSAFRE
jgi:hypothetical protein